MDKDDEKLQRKMLLQSLMECAGMKEFKSDMSDDMAYANSELEKDTKGYVTEARVAKLNYDLGLKAGLEMVLNRLANYEDELVEQTLIAKK